MYNLVWCRKCKQKENGLDQNEKKCQIKPKLNLLSIKINCLWLDYSFVFF